jgi:hypothetical protein
MDIEPKIFSRAFDRQPFGFSHNLGTFEAFSEDSLIALAKVYDGHPGDYFVSAGAPAADSVFFSVPSGQYGPHAAIQQLDSAAIRILLKRPENHDPRFRRILDQLFEQVVQLRGGLKDETVVRLESAIFITSASTTTPFHFDPEIAFFAQIQGEKIYHLYSPDSLQETELERFYLQGLVSIGQIPLEGRDPTHEHVFSLSAGRGMHQPQNSPHWVQTNAERSVSYSFVFETDVSRATGRTRAFNHYVRKCGLRPAHPGSNPALDALKARSMQAMIPIRQRASRLLRKMRHV